MNFPPKNLMLKLHPFYLDTEPNWVKYAKGNYGISFQKSIALHWNIICGCVDIAR
jgi:hypothetical protein